MARHTKISNHDKYLLDLETQLAGTLRRIHPSNDVVQRLKERLHFPDRAEIVLRLQDWRRLFFVFSGVMSGMLVILTVARAFYYFVGKRHM